MAIVASSIINRVRTQLIDQGANGAPLRWSDAELLKWLSDGCRTIVAITNSAANRVIAKQLDAGTRQKLPADGHTLLGIVRNTNDDGTKPGRATRIVTREIIDAQNPDWHAMKPTKIVQNYIYDPEDQLAFYVYPPNDGTGYVELNYAVMPGDVTDLGATLVVQDIYQTPLFDYVMFRAHLKDSDYAGGQSAATAYLQAFTTFMGVSETSLSKENVNLQLLGYNPDTKGAAR